MSVKRYDSMGFESEHGIYVRWVDHDEAITAMTNDRDYHRSTAMAQSVYWRNFYASQAALERRGAEARGWKRLAFDLIKAVGGTQRISTMTAMNAHTEDTLEAHRDHESGDMVYRVYRATMNRGVKP
jgi:hypothetical protein